ncbi:hypothetical protein EV421DRAFT_1906175 [Armillaria borealis]|uniref:Uncharacterized protein n=1 Tax=Armillaria borealis TaxID=47425 RepID=A0AA39JBV4_9AGAR|nr:hypothetical protein EV421DRAFT_1906175 [Armillaria borealis]
MTYQRFSFGIDWRRRPPTPSNDAQHFIFVIAMSSLCVVKRRPIFPFSSGDSPPTYEDIVLGCNDAEPESWCDAWRNQAPHVLQVTQRPSATAMHSLVANSGIKTIVTLTYTQFPGDVITIVEETNTDCACLPPAYVPSTRRRSASTEKKEYKSFMAARSNANAPPPGNNSVGLQQDPGRRARRQYGGVGFVLSAEALLERYSD